jgi:hypothetical protein
MSDEHIWVRNGDADDYHQFETVEDAAEDLHNQMHPDEDGFDHEMTAHVVERFTGRGYIGAIIDSSMDVSFYWGDDDAQFVRELSDEDIITIRDTLNGHAEKAITLTVNINKDRDALQAMCERMGWDVDSDGTYANAVKSEILSNLHEVGIFADISIEEE